MIDQLKYMDLLLDIRQFMLKLFMMQQEIRIVLGLMDKMINFFLFIFEDKGRINKIRSAANRAITPPSLLGIDRKIAYTQRKYHSGLM